MPTTWWRTLWWRGSIGWANPASSTERRRGEEYAVADGFDAQSDPDLVLLLDGTMACYYRGMDGDKLGSGTRNVTVTDSEGVAVADLEALAGQPREVITYNSGQPSAASPDG